MSEDSFVFSPRCFFSSNFLCISLDDFRNNEQRFFVQLKRVLKSKFEGELIEGKPRKNIHDEKTVVTLNIFLFVKLRPENNFSSLCITL